MGCCCSERIDSYEKTIKTTSESEIDEETTSSTILKRRPSCRSKQYFEHLTPSSVLNNRYKLRKSQTENFSSRKIEKDVPVQVKSFIKISTRENYTTKKKIYHGACGDVLLTVDNRTGLKQVIKEFKNSAVPLRVQEKFILQTQNFLSFDHPNIASLKEVYESAKGWYLVYEHLAGRSLLTKVNNEIIDYSSACSITRDILNGINYCHQNRIYHLGLSLGKVIASSRGGKIYKIIGFTYPWELEERVKVNEAVSCYMAPEVLEGDFTQPESDVWSLGVMLYSMIQGKPPFRGKNIVDLKEEYQRGIKEEEHFWGYTSSELDDLLKKMLEYDYKKRITIKDALNHPWIKNNNPTVSILENKKAIKNFIKFAQKNKIARKFFSKAILADQSDNYELIELYKSLDTDKDEKISKEELLREAKNLDVKTQRKLEKAINRSDFFEKGPIGYSEFIAACSDWSIEENINKLEKVFKSCDLSESGQLSLRNLKASFGGFNKKEWKAFFGNANSDHFGTMSFEKLKKYYLA